MNENRERLGSRLGFIMLSAGCAIGCGNVWKFPWMTGQYGGGGFVLVYILCLLLLGLPAMTMEFAMGRASQASPVRMYQKLERPGQKWHIHGYLALLGNIALMAFYTVVTGWMMYYFVKFLLGQSANLGFVEMITNPGVNVIYLLIAVVLGFGVLSFNLQGGLERVTKYLMTALFVLMIVLAIHSFTLSGAKDGLAFYLVPDFSKINGSVIVGAMNQAFFTLSLGIGSMAICSPRALPTIWRSTPARRCSSTRWPPCSTTWRAAASGVRCSSCSWSSPRSPRSWRCLKTFSPACAR